MRGLTCIVIFCMTAALSEAKFKEGHCPTNVVSTPEFDINKYKGIWYTQYRTPFEDHVHDCTATSVFLDDENGYYMKTFTQRNINKPPIVKRFVVYNDHLTGIFRARPLEVSGNPIPITNWILDTDYKTFAVRFSCYNVSDTSHQALSLQTRQQFPKYALLNQIQIAASRSGFSLRTVLRVKQKACPELPNPSNMSPEEDSDDDSEKDEDEDGDEDEDKDGDGDGDEDDE